MCMLVGVGGLDTGQTVYSVFLFNLFFPTPSGVRVLRGRLKQIKQLKQSPPRRWVLRLNRLNRLNRVLWGQGPPRRWEKQIKQITQKNRFNCFSTPWVCRNTGGLKKQLNRLNRFILFALYPKCLRLPQLGSAAHALFWPPEPLFAMLSN